MLTDRVIVCACVWERVQIISLRLLGRRAEEDFVVAGGVALSSEDLPRYG